MQKNINKIIILITIILFSGCAKKEEVVYLNNTNNYYKHKPSNNKSKKTYSYTLTQKKYKVLGKWYYPKSVSIGYTQIGISSWYGPNFHGKLTSNGETYNMYDYTCASKTLPMNTMLKVTNLSNNKNVVVRVNDRGPFVNNRITDLSYIAGKKIGLDKSGIAKVKIEVIGLNKRVNNIPKSSNLRYNIQIGAFKHRDGAKIFKKEFGKLHTIKIIKKKGVYKVFFIGFKNYSEAQNFKKRNGVTGFIVKD